MTDHWANKPGMMKMDQARELMQEGQYGESMLLALEVLLQELNNLRESLIALQMVARLELESAGPAREEPPQPDYFWLPPAKPRLVH